MDWGEYYPQDCPPKDAIKPSMKVFRLAVNATPTREEFDPHIITRKKRYWKDDCIASGLSVYTEQTDACLLVKRIPKLRKQYNYIASATLNETDGLIKHTPGEEESHHTWWMCEESNVWQDFNNVFNLRDI